MLAGERPTFEGRWYRVRDAINSPGPLSRIPVMIGGGEKKTLQLVALYADEANIICQPNEIQRKLDALAGHCDQLGRDRSELVVSLQAGTCVAPTHEQAVAEFDAALAARGINVASMGQAEAAAVRARTAIGSPDEVGEILAGRLVAGVNGFTVNAPANGHIEGRVALLGEVMRKVLGI